METSRATAEDPVFGQSGAANEVETTREAVPVGWQSVDTSSSCSELGNIAGYNVGPNTLQENITNITTNLGNSASFTSFLNPSNPPANTPQAYLTVLFFDERFNPVPASDGGVYQQQVASTWTAGASPLAFTKLKVPKNGYAYVYISNLSDQSVYFDNLAVSITAGNIAEEDHYYPFGLKIASISSRRVGDANEGTIKNNYLYNDKEFFDDGDLDWYDYGFRNYDPQIGRFPQMDPLTDDLPLVSPYQYAFNDPITNIDQDGLEGIPCPVPPGAAVGFLGNLTQSLTTVLSAISPAISYVDIGINISATTKQEENSVKNSDDLNGEMASQAVGTNDGYDWDADGDADGFTGNGSGNPGGGGGGNPKGTTSTSDKILKATVITATRIEIGGGGPEDFPADVFALGVLGTGVLVTEGVDLYHSMNGSYNPNADGLPKGMPVNDSKIYIPPEDQIRRELLNPPAKPGNAPTFKKDGTPVEIHHVGQSPTGPYQEMHRDDHRGKGKDKENHPDKGKPSRIKRQEFEKDKREYWKKEYFPENDTQIT